MKTTRTLEFPEFDSFEKETGQEDGLEFARHKCYQNGKLDRKSTRLNSSHSQQSRMPSSA